MMPQIAQSHFLNWKKSSKKICLKYDSFEISVLDKKNPLKFLLHLYYYSKNEQNILLHMSVIQ